MSIDIYTYLIVCPLVFLSGFVDAIAGGGGLIVKDALDCPKNSFLNCQLF